MTVLNQIRVNWGVDYVQSLQYFSFNVFVPASAGMPGISYLTYQSNKLAQGNKLVHSKILHQRLPVLVSSSHVR